jgi:hypothetical protein
MAGLAGSGTLIPRQVTEHLRGQRAAFQQTLQRAQRLGESVPDPDPTAALLLAATLGIFTTARATRAGPEAYDQLDSLRHLINTWHPNALE